MRKVHGGGWDPWSYSPGISSCIVYDESYAIAHRVRVPLNQQCLSMLVHQHYILIARDPGLYRAPLTQLVAPTNQGLQGPNPEP